MPYCLKIEKIRMEKKVSQEVVKLFFWWAQDSSVESPKLHCDSPGHSQKQTCRLFALNWLSKTGKLMSNNNIVKCISFHLSEQGFWLQRLTSSFACIQVQWRPVAWVWLKCRTLGLSAGKHYLPSYNLEGEQLGTVFPFHPLKFFLESWVI